MSRIANDLPIEDFDGMVLEARWRRTAIAEVLDDLRHAIRGLARSKTTAAVLLVSLALGTGANATLYSVMDALLLQPPGGVVDASRLVTVFTSQFNGGTNGLSSYPDYVSLKTESSAFAALSAVDDSAIEPVRLGDSIQRVRVAAVSDEFFLTLGLGPHAGRLLTTGDGAADAAPAIISFTLWSALGSPAEIVGKPVSIGDRKHTIVGIAPPRFDGLQLGRESGVWVPLAADSDRGRGERRLTLVGRLAADADLDRAHRESDAIGLALADRYPETNRGTLTDADEPRRMTALQYSRLDPSSRHQVILISVVVFGATGLLLLSACVNAGSLLLSRSAARRRELAVKVALGASRRLLVRQVVVESLFVSLAGAGLGLLLAYWTAGILPAQFAPEEAEMLDTSLDVAVAGAVVAFSCVAGALFAIGPARHAIQTIDAEVLRADAAGISTRTGGGRFRTIIVTGQVALSTVLLIGAGLLIQALSVALEGDVGPGGHGVAIAFMRMPGALQGDTVRGIQFHNAAGQMAYKIDGAEAAGWVATLPVGRSTSQAFEFDAGRPGITETLEVDVNVATSGYFHAMRIPLIEGRLFNADDGALAKPVVIVNDVLARRYFGTVAVGRHLRDPEGTMFEIVGVVRSGKYRTLQQTIEPMVYFSLSQRTPEHMHLVVRSTARPERVTRAMRDGLTALDAGVAIGRTMTFDEHVREALKLDRLLTTVVAASGLAALVLATIGVYGVIDDGVRRRTPEIGLRMALGADTSQILRLVFGEGLHLTVGGSVAGVAAALLLGHIVRAFVHALPPVDIISLAVAPLALILVVIGAAALPTRRALRVSPTIALRADA